MAETGDNSKAAVNAALNGLLADTMALYFKTKHFHWHVKGPEFRSLHLLFDEQATEIFATTDIIAERVRKNGGATLTSIGSIARLSQIADQDATDLEPMTMVSELRDDNRTLLSRIQEVKAQAAKAGDNATEGLADDWTDQTEERIWFLGQTLQ